MHLIRTKELRKEFNARDKDWRIEAVIHDGNWYDFNKWRRVARVKDFELQEWIDNNIDKLIVSDQGSYRVSYEEIIRWYEEKEIPLDEQIIPNNFPPKLWNGMTEIDVFQNAPRRRVGTVSFVAENDEILKKCTEILRGTAKIYPDKNNRHKAHGLSALHIKQLLSKGLTEEEFNSLDVKTRAVLMQRELTDFPETWLVQALEFYTKIFAPGVLKSSMSTISIYLPDRGSQISQTIIWVITAMKKFDETASVPFSGYLSTVLSHWPYDLPDEHLGKELSNFQRQRKRAIDEVQSNPKYEGREVPVELLAEVMDMPIDRFMELSQEHDTWMSERNATTLTWEDSANEKAGVLVGVTKTTHSNREKLHHISMAAVKAAVDTKDWESAFNIIEQLDTHDVDLNLNERLSDEFVAKFAKHFSVITDEKA